MKALFFRFLLFIIVASVFACNKNESDGNKPYIVLLGPNPLNWALEEPYIDPGAEAYVVNQSGDTTSITSKLVMTDNVDETKEGTYSVNYNVTDADGNAAEQKTRAVKIVLGK